MVFCDKLLNPKQLQSQKKYLKLLNYLLILQFCDQSWHKSPPFNKKSFNSQHTL